MSFWFIFFVFNNVQMRLSFCMRLFNLEIRLHSLTCCHKITLLARWPRYRKKLPARTARQMVGNQKLALVVRTQIKEYIKIFLFLTQNQWVDFNETVM